jgi:hypothetical protein
MKIRKTFTLSVYSRLHNHVNEIALSANFTRPFSFGLTIGEWSWHFGIGAEGEGDFYGPFLSYVMPVIRTDMSGGYFTAGLSTDWWWESS